MRWQACWHQHGRHAGDIEIMRDPAMKIMPYRFSIGTLPGREEAFSLKTSIIRSFALVCLLALLPAPCIMGGSAEAADKKYQRTVQAYTIPDVVLINQDGKKVRLRKLLLSDKPVIIDFIFGTCTTICPVLSAGFSNLQHKLGPESGKVSLVSISLEI